MSYIYETHAHCSQCSKCAKSTSIEMVQACKAAGYTGMVLTDHFIYGNTAVDRSLPWDEQMKCYYQAYLDAKPTADALDFDLIFGFEHAYGDGKEVLIYGLELDFLLANPDIPDITLDELTERVQKAGGIVVQAHPYRERGYINMAVGPRADLVDGIEVYNPGNNAAENARALELAGQKDYIITCGGDVHETKDKKIGLSGVVLPYRVRSSKEFADALKKREHGFLVNRKIVPVIEVCHLEA